MRKFFAAIIVVAFTLFVVPTLAFGAVAPDKVFVCKYVGTPGVDEVLQTGQNPISVSISSIADFPGVGGFFADAQGRSLVIAFDTGQGEPAPSCPEPENPPPFDQCPDIPGNQPEGTDCNPPPPPTDVCPNIEGVQETVPPGMGIVNGECVPVDVTPFCAPPQVFNPLTGLCESPPGCVVNCNPTPPCIITGAGLDGNIPPSGNTNDNCEPLNYPPPFKPPPVITGPIVPAATPIPPAPPPTTKPVVKPKPKPKPTRKPVAKKKPKPKPKPVAKKTPKKTTKCKPGFTYSKKYGCTYKARANG